MTELETNLRNILNEKETKILPENIKKDVQIFDTVGTLEAGTEINNQDKEITTNGTYTADEGYTGLGTVTVNVPQTGDVPVKLFETEEQMQADTTAKEGDLAVVYRSEVQGVTADSRFQTATFPDTVVLDTAMTNNVEIRYRSVDSSVMFDCMGSLDSSSFMMDCYTDSGSIRIQYESSDGITYTRTDTTGNPVDFGTEIYYEMPEMWNDAIGKFIQIGGSTFEGLFNYSPIISDEIVTFGSVKYKLPKAIINYSETVDFNNKINGLMFRTDSYVNNRANSIMKVNNYEEINGIRCAKSGSLYFIMAGYPLTAVITATNETRIAFTGYTGGTSSGNTTYVRKVDFDENGITNTTDYPTEQLPANFEALSVKGQTYYWDISAADDTAMKTYVNGINGNTVTIPQRGSSTTTLSSVSNNAPKNPEFNTNVLKWLYAPTQLTLTKANELLPGKIAYGKNGVVEGDGSIMIPANTFTDNSAMLWANIQKQYDDMEVRVLTDDDKTVDKNIYIIPTKSDGTVLWDTSSVTGMNNMFLECKHLIRIPLLDTSKVTSMYSAFQNCTSLTAIPQLNTSSVTGMQCAFESCSSLAEIPQLDTSKVSNMYCMFIRCTNLITVPQLNTSEVTNMQNMFYSCTSLSDDSLNNILAMCTNATKYTGTKTLKYIGLTSEQATKCTTLSNYSAFTSAGWTTGY